MHLVSQRAKSIGSFAPHTKFWCGGFAFVQAVTNYTYFEFLTGFIALDLFTETDLRIYELAVSDTNYS